MSDSMFKKNKVTSAPRTISFIIMGFEEDDFILDPEYQRDYVWEEDQKQDLMHSLFNNLPIGSFALIEKEMSGSGGYIEIVDGKQRMTTLWKYFNNEFPYICPITWKKVYFRDLSTFDQRTFKNTTTISVNTLEADISELEKFEYFHAVNFAGVPQSNEHRAFVEKRIEELRLAA